MQKRISIEKAEWKDEELKLFPHSIDFEIDNLEATEQVLVDSDQLAFIYILEQENEYVYLSLSSPIWPELKKVLTDGTPVALVLNDVEIELKGIKDELEYLVQNIEGNANYGNDMVKEVEEIFIN